MPNKNYNRGRSREYQYIKEAKQAGSFVCARTAGSHSKFDCIIVPEGVFSNYSDPTAELVLAQIKSKKGGRRKQVVEISKIRMTVVFVKVLYS